MATGLKMNYLMKIVLLIYCYVPFMFIWAYNSQPFTLQLFIKYKIVEIANFVKHLKGYWGEEYECCWWLNLKQVFDVVMGFDVPK